MATGARKGLNPARTQGQGRDNGGLTTYTIASAYGTNLGLGTPVKLVSGNLQVATNGTNCIGVLQGVEYVHPNGQPLPDKYFPASTTSTSPIYGRVVDNPGATFRVKADGTVAQVLVGGLYAMNALSVDTATGREQGTVKVLTTVTGSLAVTGTNNAALTGLANTDAFSVKSSVANVATTITIVTNQTPAQLLALLNAVPGISAALNASNFLVLTATDGGSIVLVDGTGTPLADSSLLVAAGTTTATVALNAAMVKVVGIPDTTDNTLEVILANHQLRDNV